MEHLQEEGIISSELYFNSIMSANFRPLFVHGISYRPTDLSLLKGFQKNVNLEHFHNFHENFPNGGHKLAFLLL